MLDPSDSAASANWALRKAITFARTSRQYPGHQTSDTAIITFVSPGPSAAANAIARIRSGIVRNTSVTRMIRFSIQPPKNPAMAPSTVPIATARMITVTPATSDTLAPTTSREKMSRPTWSVPIQ